MQIKTNKAVRPLMPLSALPPSRQEYFDYIREDERHDYRFVKYKGWWYDVFDMMRTPNDLRKWDVYQPDSAFSGVVIKFIEDDSVICGTYFF